jgi:hypothetical protein
MKAGREFQIPQDIPSIANIAGEVTTHRIEGTININGGDGVSVMSEAGNSVSNAIVVSPTVSVPNTEETTMAGKDGRTISTAIPVSPNLPMEQTSSSSSVSREGVKSTSENEGRSKDSAVAVSPNASEAIQPMSSEGINLCRSIVPSPVAKGKGYSVSEATLKKWKLSPLVGAHLGLMGLGKQSSVSVSPEIQAAIRNLSKSVKKLGILSRFAEEKASTSGSSSRKRKKMHEVFKSSDAVRDTRMGMLTPPSFSLGSMSDDTPCSEQEIDDFTVDENAAPELAMRVAPLAWAKPEGTVLLVFLYHLMASYYLYVSKFL